MNKYEKNIDAILKDSKAVLIRNKNHQIWRLPNGHNFVQPCTPSDSNWSRLALGTLRRSLKEKIAEDSVPDAAAPDQPTPKRQRRPDHAPVPREESELIIPSLGGGAVSRRSDYGFEHFRSISEVVEVVYEVESFWRLNHSGRIRVLLNLAKTFAQAEAIPARYISVSPQTFEMEKSDLQKFLWSAMTEMWRGIGAVPALWINDPIEGELLIETTSLRFIANFEQLFSVEAKFENSIALNVRPLYEEEKRGIPLRSLSDSPPYKCILYEFIKPDFAKTKKHHFHCTESWTNPAMTRSVIREILSQHSKRI